jgi:hypothetical protein
MSKVLFISHDDGGYYEPTIEVEVIEEDEVDKREESSYMNYFVCRTSEELAHAVLELSNEYAKFHVEIDYLKTIMRSKFSNVVKNYEFLQDLKTKAYELDLISEFREFFYHQEDGYGEFRQEVKVFDHRGNFLDMDEYPSKFKEYILTNISSKLAPLIGEEHYNSVKVEHIRKEILQLEELLVNYQAQLKGVENIVEETKISLTLRKEKLRKIEEELQ